MPRLTRKRKIKPLEDNITPEDGSSGSSRARKVASKPDMNENVAFTNPSPATNGRVPPTAPMGSRMGPPSRSDFEVTSRFFRITKDALKCNSSLSIMTSGDLTLHHAGECPDTNKDIEAFILKHRLRHGDVVCFGDYRDTGSYIVLQNYHSGKFTWDENPDDSGSGYLTIPAKVLWLVKDALTKYKCLLNGEHALINFYLSPEDKFIVDHIGVVPDTWEFILNVSFGEPETLSVKLPKKSWQEFDLVKNADETWKKLKALLGPEPPPQKQSEFSVHLKLQGEKLRKYKEKYTIAGDRLAWLTVKPELPESWVVTKGPAGQMADRVIWVWHFTGLQEHHEQAKKSVQEFLKGFNYKLNSKI